ncbi:MAG: hypothetical protein GWN00_39215 [Aliifodinibius sp.]|nr:nucleotidyltransferase domain-containing protein [Fodinibius sp.]NIV15030.1 hypothetical protein [Fodinibius sp.]NIY30593.1 hypothetical protein [Fodinibius sp.]
MNIENTIRQFFKCHAEIIAVYLYGSAITGRIHSESDIDIGVLFHYDKVPSFYQLLDLRTNLSERVDGDVDLVCLNEVSPILQKQVISKGKPILVNNQHQLNQFIIKAFTDYVDLKITRQHLEKYILNRRVLDG